MDIINTSNYDPNIPIDRQDIADEPKVSPSPYRKYEDNRMNFDDAIKELVAGLKVRRLEWEDPDVYCVLDNEQLKIYTDGELRAWIVTLGDIYGEDWISE